MPLHLATVTVMDQNGLHARPAGQLVKLVNDSGLVVRIGRVGEELVSANSPLRVMALKAKCSDLLTVEIESDEPEAAESLVRAIQLALGESR
jgi:phosphotransferase system HPr (HPr) family protein